MSTSVLTANKTSSNSLVTRYPVLTFVFLAYALTWPFLILEVLASYQVISFELPMPLMILQGFMPGLAAVIVTGLISGKAGIRALLSKLLIVRVGLRWHTFAIFSLAVVCAIAIALNNLFGTSAIPYLSTKMPSFSGPIEFLINIVVLLIFSAIFNSEELGWRGFALPRLQSKYNALTSSLIISIPWLFFHLPLFFKLGSSQADSSFVVYGIGIIAQTVIFTWMFNNTRGSVLLATLLHAASNTWTQIFSINSDATNHFLAWMMSLTLVIIAVMVTITSGAENLSRTNTRIQE